MHNLIPENIVASARSFIGTPWHHSAAVKGPKGGIDCTNLLFAVALENGAEVELPDPQYNLADNFGLLCSEIEKYCVEIDESKLQAGDLFVFRGTRILNHCGIYSGENTFIHAWNSPSVMKVVETPFDDTWKHLMVSMYRYRGVKSPQ